MPMPSRSAHPVVAAVLTGLTVLAAAGCGSDSGPSPSTSQTPPSVTVSPSTSLSALPSVTASPTPTASRVADPTVDDPAAPAACRGRSVAVKLVKGSSAAGQAYNAVVVTNTGTAACSLRGYNTLRFVGQETTTIGKLVTPPVTTVVLKAGKSASATIGTVTGLTSASSPTGSVPCTTAPAAVIVTLPRDDKAVRVPWTGGPICPKTRIVQSAYLPGTQTA
jgi:hypothetical protein